MEEGVGFEPTCELLRAWFSRPASLATPAPLHNGVIIPLMSPFKTRVIEIVNMIPEGEVVSYGQVALMAGVPRGARQVGWILFAAGPEAPDMLPWWRVVNNEGRISIKNPDLDPSEQKEKLETENIPVDDSFNLDIEKYRWRPDQNLLEKLQLEDEYVFKILEKF